MDSIPVGEEAAGPAESGYLFFPRPAVEDSAIDESTVEATAFDSAAVMSESGASLGDEAWNAAERFSKGNFHEAIPVQYPLDDSAYEAEAPTGDDPDAAQGRWRDSASIVRPRMWPWKTSPGSSGTRSPCKLKPFPPESRDWSHEPGPPRNFEVCSRSVSVRHSPRRLALSGWTADHRFATTAV